MPDSVQHHTSLYDVMRRYAEASQLHAPPTMPTKKTQHADNERMNTPAPSPPKVLAFDVFGTVVDWHSGIAREVQTLRPNTDGDAFALAWRAGYQPAMRRVMSGELGWTLIDDLNILKQQYWCILFGS